MEQAAVKAIRGLRGKEGGGQPRGHWDRVSRWLWSCCHLVEHDSESRRLGWEMYF